MRIEIINVTKNPLTLIGLNASECYNTELKDDKHASRIAKHCINSGHGRNLEFANVNFVVSGISARMAREFYTHIGGSPTRVQASTRYITYSDFDYYTPKFKTTDQELAYHEIMQDIQEGYGKLKELGLENDITGYVLPLSMTTTICVSMNARTLENLFNQRLCYRALEEFRDFAKELKRVLSGIDEEWKWISDKLFVPKCVKAGYCTEHNKKCVLYKENKNV